jgi:hypothetical protein
MYKGGVMVYVKVDASVPSIGNEVIFDELDPSTMAWYVSISTDNKFLLFAKDGANLQYDGDRVLTWLEGVFGGDTCSLHVEEVVEEHRLAFMHL